MNAPLVSIDDVGIGFRMRAGLLGTRHVQAVSGLSLSVAPGETVAVIGASGSGKTLLAEAVMNILPGNATRTGSITYRGQQVDEALMRRLRGRAVTYIPQSVSHLDPLMTVGRQVRLGLPRADARRRQRELFRRYGLSDEVAGHYPMHLSGGMLRRVLFATAVRDEAELVIADEPTPGLDPVALAEITGHLAELRARGTAVLLITHDILAAVPLADRVAIMQAGRLVAVEAASRFVGDGDGLEHPFARALWRSLPQHRFIEGGPHGAARR